MTQQISDLDTEWVTCDVAPNWEIEVTYISSGEHGTIHNARLVGSEGGDYIAKLLYIRESYDTEIIAYNILNAGDIKIAPKLHYYFICPGNLISGRRGGNTYVLILDKIQGTPMTDLVLEEKISPIKALSRVSESVGILHNYYNITHGDPHGRNVMITDDDELLFIDFESSIVKPSNDQKEIDIEVLLGSSKYDYGIEYNAARDIISRYFPLYFKPAKNKLLTQYILY